MAAPVAAAGRVASARDWETTKLVSFPLLRLSRSQVQHIAEDVLGDATPPLSDLLTDDPLSDAVSYGDLVVGYHHAGLAMATKAFGPDGKLAGYCKAAGGEGSSCARKFVTEIAPLLWRRTVTTEEVDSLLSTFANYEELGAPTSMIYLLTTLIASPSFFTIVETPPADKGGRLVDEQTAARMSLFLWDSAPDGELMASAASGVLRSAEGLQKEVTRMMASPKFGRFAERLFDSWLKPAALRDVQKAQSLEKTFTPALVEAMIGETRAFAASVFAGEGSDFGALMTSTRSFVNGDLAKVYGLAGTFGAELAPADISTGGRRAGLLTIPGLLARLSKPEEPSVAMRGIFVLESLLCDPPAPPPDAFSLPGGDVGGKTMRERVAAHAVGGCAGCHRTIDGLGLGFEQYDTIGRYVTTDHDVPVTGAGTFYDSAGKATEFRGAVELGKLLAASPDARNCFVNHWFERNTYRKPTVTDAAALGPLVSSFVKDGNMKKLTIGYVLSDAFAKRTFQ